MQVFFGGLPIRESTGLKNSKGIYGGVSTHFVILVMHKQRLFWVEGLSATLCRPRGAHRMWICPGQVSANE
jgi:hypothetical protein